MDRRWSHVSFWLETVQEVYSFRPEKYSICLASMQGYRLWPPSLNVPRGRPRTRPLKKRSQCKERIEFESRPHNRPLAVTSSTNTRPSYSCRMCGSKGHDARSCKSATAGDIFLRCVSVSQQMLHVALPPPPCREVEDEQIMDCHNQSGTSCDENVGKPVLKIFKDPLTSRKRPFSGVCEVTLQHLA